MQAIKLVTFDATNTLLRFKIPPWQYYSFIARDYGFFGKTELLKSRMIDSMKIMEQKHPNFGKEDLRWENWWKNLVKLTFQGQLPANANVDEIANKLIEEFKTSNCWAVADGSEKILELLKKNKLSLGVISNFDPRLIDILHNISLYNKFDFVLTSYEVGYSKPDRRIFESAMKACREPLKPSECLHIGDNVEKDYKGAKAAGWHALLIASTNKNPQTTSDHVFMNIPDLCKALEQNKIKL